MRTILLNVVFVPLVLASSSRLAAKPQTGLRIDSENPHYLVYNGRPFYLIGSGMESVCQPWSRTEKQWRDYLNMLHRNGFNRVRFFPWDLCWADSLQPTFSPWQVSDAKDWKFDPTRFNEKYWRLVKKITDMARQRDIVVEYILFDYCCLRDQGPKRPWSHCPLAARNGGAVPGRSGKPGIYMLDNYSDFDLFKQPFNSSWNWKRRNQWLQQCYVKYTIDQLGEFPNVYWEIMNEQGWNKVEPDGVRWTRHWLAFLDKYDPNRRLRSINAADVYDQMKGIDIVCEHPIPFFHKREMTTPEIAVATIADNLRFGKPVVCDETGLFPPQQSTEDAQWRTYSKKQLANERRAFWFAFVAGGHWTAVCWQDFSERDTHRWVHHLADFVKQVDYRHMQPHDELVAGGHCLANIGNEYVVYTGSGSTLHVDCRPAAMSQMICQWFDPRRGEFAPASWTCDKQEGRAVFMPPSHDDWTLWIRKKTNNKKVSKR